MLELALRHVRMRERFDHRFPDPRGALETFESCVDSVPAGAHQIDEQREVVHAGVALRQEIALEPLEAADRLVEEPTNLRDVPRDGEHLDPNAVSNGSAHVFRYRHLELCGGDGERLDLASRALQSSLEGRDRAGEVLGNLVDLEAGY